MIINPGTMHNLERTVHCARCDKPIMDRFLLNVLERPWHCKCVQCVECGCSLTEKCFSRDGHLYCKEDFFRRFGTKCGGCGQSISPNDLVRKAREKVFHLKCFTCMVCRKQLSTGEELYVLDENRFICKEDYLASKYSQGSDGEDEDTEMEHNLLDKIDDTLSDKGSSYHDDDSIDSGLPPMGGLKLPNTPTLQGLGTQPDFTFKSITSKDSLIDLNKNNAQLDIKIKEEIIDKNISLDKNDNPKLLDNITDKETKSDSSSCKDGKDSEDDKLGEKTSQGGTKRRGPRTTIKAKQLETLKAAFQATPKPTRHIREQLAQETGLNMRVIQVWFQNRRSKERRMKQLSALGARRQFYRNPRRMRMGDDGSDLMGPPGFAYFGEGDFYPNPGFPGYPGGDYPFHHNGDMGFLPPGGPQVPPMMDQMPPPGHMHDPQFGMPPGDMMGPASAGSTPDTSLPSMQPLEAFVPMPPRSMSNFSQQMQDTRPPEMTDPWL